MSVFVVFKMCGTTLVLASGGGWVVDMSWCAQTEQVVWFASLQRVTAVLIIFVHIYSRNLGFSVTV